MSENSFAVAPVDAVAREEDPPRRTPAQPPARIPRDESDLCRYSLRVTSNQELHILSDPINSWGYATGNTLWTSSEELIDFFASSREYPEGYFRGRRVLELGAGLGAVGMALGKLGATVVCTDKAESLDLMRRNVEENFGASDGSNHVQVECLKWGTDKEKWPAACQGPFDLVVGSDVVYGPKRNYVALAQTLLEVTDPATEIIFAIPDRQESKTIAQDLTQRQFHSQRLMTIHKPHFENPVVIYRLSKKVDVPPPNGYSPATDCLSGAHLQTSPKLTPKQGPRGPRPPPLPQPRRMPSHNVHCYGSGSQHNQRPGGPYYREAERKDPNNCWGTTHAWGEWARDWKGSSQSSWSAQHPGRKHHHSWKEGPRHSCGHAARFYPGKRPASQMA
uniref:Calmodulin-lysine N-methyltransferase n=1 Tax=Eutreptiella gymnastica TaxID=73025 RepID=A0A7S1N0Y0_9EUGL